MSAATNFLAWLIEDVNCVTAEVGSPRDAQLKEFEAQGFLKFMECFADNNSYAITNKGATGFLDSVPTR